MACESPNDGRHQLFQHITKPRTGTGEKSLVKIGGRAPAEGYTADRFEEAAAKFARFEHQTQLV
jgi:hypothetical protein